jgi:ABC-2 type transport system ATP-binding protein
MTVPAIEVAGLCRNFGKRDHTVRALSDVSFQIDQGAIVGLLGSNGAGKTTLTKILATLLLPTSGSARIFNHDVTRDLAEVRRYTGVVFGGERGLYGKLTGRENLRFFAVLGGAGRRHLRAHIEEALDEVGLTQAAGRPVETYSKGMRQRLHIAVGMFSRPRLLLLDEPTVGLDPIEAERLRGTLADLRTGGVSILLTSHQLLDIERLADRVLILDHGRLSADLGMAEFAHVAGYTATVTVRGVGAPPALTELRSSELDVKSVSPEGDGWVAQLRVRSWGVDSLGGLGLALSGLRVVDLEVAPLRMEDIYAHLMRNLETARAAVSPGPVTQHDPEPWGRR